MGQNWPSRARGWLVQGFWFFHFMWHRPVSEDGSWEGDEGLRESGRLMADTVATSCVRSWKLPLSFWGPVPCAFTPHGGSPETVPATSTDTQARPPQGLECWCLADSALQWKSARIPWFKVSRGCTCEEPEEDLKLLSARSLTVHGNGVTRFAGWLQEAP